MDTPQKILEAHIIKTVPMTEDEFADLITHFTLKKISKGDYLIRKGNYVNEVYFILSGLVKLTYTDRSAKQHIISFAMEDWWETDFEAFYLQRKATLSLECLEDTEVYCLTFDDFNKVCDDLQTMERFFFKKSISGHIASQQRILSFLTSTAKERYEQLLVRSPNLLQRVPKTQLASFLGVSRETLSRLFS